MDLFFELNRSCNMACSHCLRGDAERTTMSDKIIQAALDKLGGLCDMVGIGGGEPLLTKRVLRRFYQQLSWYLNTDYFESLWIVTNGKTLVKEIDNYEYSDANGPLMDTLLLLSYQVNVSLAVSIDRFHGPDANLRRHRIEEYFGWIDDINVSSMGPMGSNSLIQMGRAYGKELKVYGGEGNNNMYYVDVFGYVWASCDLSYEFMKANRDTVLCYGNVLTHTTEDFQQAFVNLEEVIRKTEEGVILVTENGITNLAVI